MVIGLVASLALLQAEPISAKLSAKVPEGKESLRWSPKGAAAAMTAAGKDLVGTIRLGGPGTSPISVRLKRTAGAEHFNELWIDLNRNGAVDPSETLTTTPTERTGKWWSSFSQVTIPIPQPDGSDRAYPISLWFVDDPAEPEAPAVLRWSRRGWHEGRTVIDGKPAYVLVTEMNMDGVFDQRDSWFLARDREALLAAMSRSLEDHAWLDGKAYRLVHLDSHGQSIAFEDFDPGFTEAEEKTQRDTLLPDKQAERAEAPVPFLHDYATAKAKASEEKKRLLVDFEATWCGPCKTMDELVYTAEAVVQAADGIVAVKVDGDVSRDLAKQYKVGAYPTMILLDEGGREIRRAVGYRSVAQMVEFLKP